MNISYYLRVARAIGYDDPAKEALWGACPQEERLAILRFLMTFADPRKELEDEIVCRPEDFAAKLDERMVALSKVENASALPLALNVFVFFAFAAAGRFSLECLQNEAYRFLGNPDPLPTTVAAGTTSWDDDSIF